MKNKNYSRYAIPKRKLFLLLENEIPGLGKKKLRAYELIELLWVRFHIPTISENTPLSSTIKDPIGGSPMIIYNPYLPLGELAFIIAHELGHLLLGHDTGNLSPRDEYDASIFACLCRIPNDLLEKIHRGLGFLNGDVLFYFLGNSQMRKEVARTIYNWRVTTYFAFKQKQGN